MSLVLYMDEHVDPAVTSGLRRRGVEVRTVQEQGQRRTPDAAILDRALANGWVVFTMDEDFLSESNARWESGEPFAGVIYAKKDRWGIGVLVEHLELAAKVYEPDEMVNAVLHIPLRATNRKE
jgi:predicted nuclease of predicted toxin-antitoxin system